MYAYIYIYIYTQCMHIYIYTYIIICIGATYITPEIDTSEAIVEFQRHFPTDFHFSAVLIYIYIYICIYIYIEREREIYIYIYSKELSFFQWTSTGISDGLSAAFSNGIRTF